MDCAVVVSVRRGLAEGLLAEPDGHLELGEEQAVAHPLLSRDEGGLYTWRSRSLDFEIHGKDCHAPTRCGIHATFYTVVSHYLNKFHLVQAGLGRVLPFLLRSDELGRDVDTGLFLELPEVSKGDLLLLLSSENLEGERVEGTLSAALLTPLIALLIPVVS